MRPQQILDTLNQTNMERFTIRCTSGAEYSIADPTTWWFVEDARILTVVLGARTTICIDPMLVESVAAHEPHDDSDLPRGGSTRIR
jgi:hypothetical protein